VVGASRPSVLDVPCCMASMVERPPGSECAVKCIMRTGHHNNMHDYNRAALQAHAGSQPAELALCFACCVADECLCSTGGESLSPRAIGFSVQSSLSSL